MTFTLANISYESLRNLSRWFASEHLAASPSMQRWLSDLVASELERRGTKGNPPAAEIVFPAEWTADDLGQALGVSLAMVAGVGGAEPAVVEFIHTLHFRLATLAAIVLRKESSWAT